MPSKITPERMLEITMECDKYEITLANDPTLLGNSYLQDMVATCRNYTNHAARLLNEVHRAKMSVELEFRRKQTAFKIASDELLATNPIVRNLPNIKDRESQINIMLRDEHREIMNLENDDLELGHIEEYVRRRHRELKDTMKEIQTQRNLVKDEHTTGSMYGDERPTSMGGSISDAFTPGAAAKPDMDVKDIERMLQEGVDSPEETPEGDVPKTIADVPSEPASVPSEPASVPSEPAVEAFVQPAPPAPSGNDEAVVVLPPKATSEEDQIRAFLAVPEAPEVPEESAPVTNIHPTADASEDDFAELLSSL